MYLLDSCVLINAARDYYRFDCVPEYWEWIEYWGANGRVKIPEETYGELTGDTPSRRNSSRASPSDILSDWARKPTVKSALVLNDSLDDGLVTNITNRGYGTDLTDEEQAQIGTDPLLVAYAFKKKKYRWVVTSETSKPKRQRAKRKIPDVCNAVGVRCCDPFEFIRTLSFRTCWRQHL